MARLREEKLDGNGEATPLPMEKMEEMRAEMRMQGEVRVYPMRMRVEKKGMPELRSWGKRGEQGYREVEEGRENCRKVATQGHNSSAADLSLLQISVFLSAETRDAKYIDLKELQKLVKYNEFGSIQHFEDLAEDDKVDVYIQRDSLNRTLKYTKTAIDELNMIASIIALVAIFIVWLIFMEILTTKMLVFVMTQLAFLAFMFGNTAKTVFEAIIFVFVMHPFDVGDRCVVDGEQMVVEEMSIFTTVFTRSDGEKLYYPNSVLAMKSIGNLYRSLPMSECLEFTFDLSTPKATIDELKAKIHLYLEENSRRWQPDQTDSYGD
ncbi:mechanosensitive ion channel protein 10-like [Hevea brasiliensis]|uniref:mechanosensitive ion channel protein 10-like n=1 Tax=Hevea brasiliensis TaxID=3981 RepID=UPI0025CC4432|nr:mechanosensitive ion channel protein 10-like [Hevea brasiliensis]